MPGKSDTWLKEQYRDRVRKRFQTLYVASQHDTEEAFFHDGGPRKSSYYTLIKGEPVRRATAVDILSALEFGEEDIELFLTDTADLAADLVSAPDARVTDARVTLEKAGRHISNLESHPVTELVRGRDDTIAWLEQLFFSGSTFIEGRKAAITGVGGMGKTTAALEFARHYANRYTHCFFCRADSQTSLIASFMTMAELLREEDAHIRRFLDAERGTRDYVPNILLAVRRWLQTSAGYLLLLDNADLIPPQARARLVKEAHEREHDLDEPDQLLGKDLLTEAELEAVFPDAASLRGHLLITSRNAIVSERVFGIVPTHELQEMTNDVAEDFLVERTGKGSKASLTPEEQESLQQIVVCLHGLPLALEQAGAYIRAKDQQFATYLGILRPSKFHATEAPIEERAGHLKEIEHRIGILERRAPALGRYGSSVARTWLISFGAVQAEQPAAAEAFTFAAFTDPDATPFVLLQAAALVLCQEDDAHEEPVLRHLPHFLSGTTYAAEITDRYDCLLESLTRYSLVRRNVQPALTFRMHRLVQAVRRMTLTDSEWDFFYDLSISALLTAFR